MYINFFFLNWFVLSNVWLNRLSLTNFRNQQKQADRCHTNLVFSLVAMKSIHSFPVPRCAGRLERMAMAEGWTAAPGRRRRAESLSALPRVSSGPWEREQQQLVITTVSATCPPYSHFHYLAPSPRLCWGRHYSPLPSSLLSFSCLIS